MAVDVGRTMGAELSLVQASAEEAQAISATMAAAHVKNADERQTGDDHEKHNGDRDRGAEASFSGKAVLPGPLEPYNPPSSQGLQTPPPGVRLHHRAVRSPPVASEC